MSAGANEPGANGFDLKHRSRALTEGHVPLWNPYEMAGTWFAADPQSGWLSLSTMGTSVAFGCGGLATSAALPDTPVSSAPSAPSARSHGSSSKRLPGRLPWPGRKR